MQTVSNGLQVMQRSVSADKGPLMLHATDRSESECF